MNQPVTKGLLLRVDALPGQEEQVAAMLQGAVRHVEAEATTPAWFAVRLGPASFAVFDVFPDEAARQAHLDRHLAAVTARVGTLLAAPPRIEHLDVVAAKLAPWPAA